MLSAAAPPTMGNTKTGTSSHKPRSPTASVDPGEFENHERNGHRDDVVPELGDRSTDEQPPEVGRHPQRRDVDEVFAHARDESSRDLE